MEPLKRIVLRDDRTEDDVFSLVALIDDAGDLVLEGYDCGKTAKAFWGDGDYEYWLRVTQADKDTVLLWLIKERFTTSSEFREWLDVKGIPNEFESWV